MIKLSVNDH